MNRPTITAAFFLLAFVEAILLISTMDYTVVLERENDRLRAQLELKKPAPDKQLFEAVLCPPDWRYSIRQRMDKRRWDGVIYHTNWRGACT